MMARGLTKVSLSRSSAQMRARPGPAASRRPAPAVSCARPRGERAPQALAAQRAYFMSTRLSPLRPTTYTAFPVTESASPVSAITAS